jgi:hypothetical protein
MILLIKNQKPNFMKLKETLIYLIEKYGDYYEEERQLVVDRLTEMKESELLQSLENMINHYINKKQLN